MQMQWRDKKRRALLKDIRKQKDFSQERMARLLGMSRATYNTKENGYSFTIQELDAIAEILKTNLNILLEA